MKQEGALSSSLKATRSRLGLSQQQLAEAAGVTRQTIGGIEAGQYAPSALVALRLAKALGCRVEDLFRLEEDLPTVEALAAQGFPQVGSVRVALAQVGGRWVAHPLQGEQAFRTEMVPADGVVGQNIGEGPLTVQLLDAPENLARTVILAGCTPALSLWARSAERWYPGLRVHWIHANSTAALQCLAREEVHAAGLHLCDPETGEQNVPYVRKAIPEGDTVLVTLGVWEEGFLTRPGDPRRLNGGADLAQEGVTLVNREAGAGARQLLDNLLRAERVPTTAIRGYDWAAGSHQEVALAVQAGKADVGVSAASVAAAYGLGFTPLQSVRYDLALRKSSLDLEPVRQLLGTLHHPWVRSQLRLLGGYDTALTGEVRAV